MEFFFLYTIIVHLLYAWHEERQWQYIFLKKKKRKNGKWLSLVLFTALCMLLSHLIFIITQQVDGHVFLVLQMILRIIHEVIQPWNQGLNTGSQDAEPVVNNHTMTPLMIWFLSSEVQSWKRDIIKCDENDVIKTKDKVLNSVDWSWRNLQRGMT